MFRKLSMFLKRPKKVVVDDSSASKSLNQELERKLEEVEECVAEKELDKGVSDVKEIDSSELEVPSVSFSEMSLEDHVKQPKKSEKKARKENESKSKPERKPDHPEAAGAEGGAHAPESDESGGNREDTPRPWESENEGGHSGIRRTQSFGGFDSGSEGYWVVTYLDRK